MSNIAWTDNAIDVLRRMWAEGHSASIIGRELGVSRSAILGKAHRIELEKRREPSRRVYSTDADRRASKRARQREYYRLKNQDRRPRVNPNNLEKKRIARRNDPGFVERHVPAELTSQPPLMMTTMQLTEQTCKFPIGDPGNPGFGFCGHPSRESGPYCEFHSRVCYQPEPSSKRKLAGVVG